MTLTHLSDFQLIAKFGDSVIEEREQLVLQLEYLAELDRRKLFLHYSSLRAYLIEEHGMEEAIVERKIRAARFLKKYGQFKADLESGKLNLSLIELALRCRGREGLVEEEFLELMDALGGKSIRAAQREIVSRYPISPENRADRIRPLNSEVSEVTFVTNNSLLDQLEEIRDLLAHSHPGIRLGELIGVLATEYRERHHPQEKARKAAERQAQKKQSKKVKTPVTSLLDLSGQDSIARSEKPLTSPDANSAISKGIQRFFTQTQIYQIIQRDGYCCSYRDPLTQKQCTSRRGLQGDHIIPWASGGETTVSNGRLVCACHHSRISFLQFGEYSRFVKPK